LLSPKIDLNNYSLKEKCSDTVDQKSHSIFAEKHSKQKSFTHDLVAWV